MEQPPAPTPRETRHRLLKMERWYRKNRRRLTVQRQEAAERLLDTAVTAAHADALGEALKAWVAEGDALAARVSELAETETLAEEVERRTA